MKDATITDFKAQVDEFVFCLSEIMHNTQVKYDFTDDDFPQAELTCKLRSRKVSTFHVAFDQMRCDDEKVLAIYYGDDSYVDADDAGMYSHLLHETNLELDQLKTDLRKLEKDIWNFQKEGSQCHCEHRFTSSNKLLEVRRLLKKLGAEDA